MFWNQISEYEETKEKEREKERAGEGVMYSGSKREKRYEIKWERFQWVERERKGETRGRRSLK